MVWWQLHKWLIIYCWEQDETSLQEKSCCTWFDQSECSKYVIKVFRKETFLDNLSSKSCQEEKLSFPDNHFVKVHFYSIAITHQFYQTAVLARKLKINPRHSCLWLTHGSCEFSPRINKAVPRSPVHLEWVPTYLITQLVTARYYYTFHTCLDQALLIITCCL